MCLLQAEHHATNGHGLPLILHGQEDRWYKKALAGNYEGLLDLAGADEDLPLDVDLAPGPEPMADEPPPPAPIEDVEEEALALDEALDAEILDGLCEALEAPLDAEILSPGERADEALEEAAELFGESLCPEAQADLPCPPTPPLEPAPPPGAPSELPGPPPLPEPDPSLVEPPLPEPDGSAPPPADVVRRPELDNTLASGNWGVFRFIARTAAAGRGGRYGAFEVRCPFHKKRALTGSTTGCAKYVRILGPEDEDRREAVHRGMWWASVHASHTRQRHHVEFEVMPDRGAGPPPPLEALVALRVDVRPSVAEVRFDDDLDAGEAEADAGAADGETEGEATPESGSEAGPAGRGTECVLLRCTGITTETCKAQHKHEHDYQSPHLRCLYDLFTTLCKQV